MLYSDNWSDVATHLRLGQQYISYCKYRWERKVLPFLMEQDPERIENRIMVDIVVSIINQTNFRFQNIFARSTTSTQAITTNGSTMVDLTDNVAPLTFGGAFPLPVRSSSITTDNVRQNTPKPSLSARGTSPRATTNKLHRSDPQTTVYFSFSL